MRQAAVGEHERPLLAFGTNRHAHQSIGQLPQLSFYIHIYPFMNGHDSRRAGLSNASERRKHK